MVKNRFKKIKQPYVNLIMDYYKNEQIQKMGYKNWPLFLFAQPIDLALIL